MVSVEQLIGELLLRHNCVIIPSFGGFVAKQASATIDYKTGVMSPPRKSLLFNRQLINNDGLLVAELAVANAIPYNEAVEVVSTLVGSWNDQLRRGERITIDKVGFLFFDQEKNIFFEQDRFFNLLLESYGLGKVHFLTESDVQLVQHSAIEKTTISEKTKDVPSAIVFDTETISINPVETEAIVIEHPAIQKRSKVWRYVAAACLAPVAFYSFWLPVKTDVLESGMISLNDFNPFYKTEIGVYKKISGIQPEKKESYKTLEESISELPEDVTVFSYEYDEDLYIPVRLKSNGELNNDSTVKTPVKSATQSNGNLEFIVGCFSNESNAENLVQTLKSKGFNAYILDVKNGLSRISAGNAISELEMAELIEKAKSQGFDGWVLKK